MGSASKNLTSEQDRGVWHVSIKPWHLEWNTPGSPGRYAGIFGGLLWKLCLYQAFIVFEAESGSRSKVESKTEKRRTDRIENLIALKNKKNPHTLCHIGLLLGLIDAVQCLRKLWTLASYKQSVTRKFNEPILLFQTKRVSFTQTLYQHKSALPYMGCCTLSCSPTKRRKRLVSTIQKTA